jgi:hypothetical protein
MRVNRTSLFDDVLEQLREVESGTSRLDRDDLTESLMHSFYELGLAIAKDPRLRESAEFKAFINESVPLLEFAIPRIDTYVHRIGDMFWGGWEDHDWFSLSQRRSAAQFLVDLYDGTPIAQELRDELRPDQFDETIRQRAKVDAYLPEGVPEGMPASHWWWRETS